MTVSTHYFFILQDPFRRNLRRIVMRYVNLSIVMVFRLVSTKVKMRFPDNESLVNAKLILDSEVWVDRAMALLVSARFKFKPVYSLARQANVEPA